jgi:cytoskeletal protein CcmA (bactofilin family)
MFKKSLKSPITTLNQEEILTILGEDFKCDGNVFSNNSARIEGEINGDVSIKKGVILGEKGSINGNLETETAIIFGIVNGNLNVKHLEIKQTGRIYGDVKTENLVIELGGKYNGKLDMKMENSIPEKQNTRTDSILIPG